VDLRGCLTPKDWFTVDFVKGYTFVTQASTVQNYTFEDLVEATLRLQPEQRHLLAQLLQVTPLADGSEDPLLTAEVLSEAGAYSVSAPLSDLHPHSHDATDAELLAAVQCISSEWELEWEEEAAL
jgi:hypothetical protein